MKRLPLQKSALLGASALLLTSWGCSQSMPYQVVARVVFEPAAAGVMLGQEILVRATALASDGTALRDLSCCLESVNPDVLEVLPWDPAGGSKGRRVRAVGGGNGELRATGGSVVAVANYQVGCPKGQGPTVHRGIVARSEKWSALASPHVLSEDVVVKGKDPDGRPARLTIESCATVHAMPGVRLSVGDDGPGELRVLGTSGVGIVSFSVSPSAPAGSGWAGIGLTQGPAAPVGATGSLTPGSAISGARISGAGMARGSDATGAAVRVKGLDESAAPLAVKQVEILDSHGLGIYLEPNGRLSSDSSGITITRSAGAPWRAHPNAVGTIPPATGVGYGGNAADEILIDGGAVRESSNWKIVSVPYRVLGDLTVTGSAKSAPLLALRPGVTMKFDPGTRMGVGTIRGESGGITVGGTVKQPVRFTSSSPQPKAGDWVGLILGEQFLSLGSQVINLSIDYAGGPSGLKGLDGDFGHAEDGSVIFLLDPASIFALEGITPRHSAGYGFVRGFTPPAPPAMSLLPKNPGAEKERATLALGPESLASPLFLSSAKIPQRSKLDPKAALCGPGAKSPPVRWEIRGDKPLGEERVKSYALLAHSVEDDRIFWLVSDLPLTARELAEGVSPGGNLPAGAKEYANHQGAPGFGGECPAFDEKTCKPLKETCDRDKDDAACFSHREKCTRTMVLTLYALSDASDLSGAAGSASAAEKQLLRAAVGQTSISAYFSSP